MKKKDHNLIISALGGAVLAVIILVLAAVFLNKSGQSKTGRDVVIFGDSIMAYSQDASSVANLVMESTGLDVLDLSLGGTLMSYIFEESTPAMQRNALSMCAISRAFLTDDFFWQNSYRASEPATDYFESRILDMQSLDLKDTRVVIIGQCINDYLCGIPAGDLSSDTEYTYSGALKKTIENIKSVNPDIRVIIVSPTLRWTDDGRSAIGIDNGGGTYEQYLEAQKEAATQMGAEYLPLTDVYETRIQTPDGTMFEMSYTVDGTHPNYYGRQAIAARISEYLTGTAAGEI